MTDDPRFQAELLAIRCKAVGLIKEFQFFTRGHDQAATFSCTLHTDEPQAKTSLEATRSYLEGLLTGFAACNQLTGFPA